MKIAVIGARELAANSGNTVTKIATKLGADLVKAGHKVVSGLAKGVDIAAMKGAGLENCIGVLATPVNVFYPPEHAEYQKKCGELIPFNQKIHKRNFILRDKTIAEISDAIIIVWTNDASGCEHVFERAMARGKCVLIGSLLYAEAVSNPRHWLHKQLYYQNIFSTHKACPNFVTGLDAFLTIVEERLIAKELKGKNIEEIIARGEFVGVFE